MLSHRKKHIACELTSAINNDKLMTFRSTCCKTMVNEVKYVQSIMNMYSLGLDQEFSEKFKRVVRCSAIFMNKVKQLNKS